jgi:hypothetical protein
MRILISKPRVWARFFVVAFVAVVAIIAIRLSETPVSAQFRPAYDISGVWKSKDPGPQVYYQNGIEVKGTYANRGFVQFITGKYVNPTTIVGVVFRRNRSNGCVTQISFTNTVTSADSMHSEAVGRDANCDIPAGWRGSGDTTRDKALSDIWY